ncbi:MAG: glutamate--tRNA ligase [Oscillatoriales cyanobacterium SM2_2_1]|nr:glutamate--tRNA ligase [Oscillatoriales cyanobacterium SM2_2_1]
MTVRVRLAPSPTGNLHIGTARTALFNWLYARRHGGTFILRVEDTDRERSRDEYTQNILDGLAWLGITYDEGPFFQTQRRDRYTETVHDLLERGLAYYCYCTETELEELRASQKVQKLAPRYDNRHRHLTVEQRQSFEAEGRRPVIRFKIAEPREIRWHDLVRDDVVWNSRDLGGDMVIARVEESGAIGLPLYNFAVVVDDIDMGISHVIRGEDHIANTAKQILLYEALGVTPPLFAHPPLILNPQGAKISKRDGATSVSEFRAMGYLPEAFNNYMILLGWSPSNGQELFSLSEAAEQFDFDRVNAAGARFDWDKLNWLNGQYIRSLPLTELGDRLKPFWQNAGIDLTPYPESWQQELTALIAPSLTVLADAPKVAATFFVDFPDYTPEILEPLRSEVVQTALRALLDELNRRESLTAAEVNELVQAQITAQKVKKGAVMKPLRLALTAESHGTELMPTLALLHQRQLAVPRLEKALSSL